MFKTLNNAYVLVQFATAQAYFNMKVNWPQHQQATMNTTSWTADVKKML